MSIIMPFHALFFIALLSTGVLSAEFVDTEYIDLGLKLINKVRVNHKVDKLKLDDNLMTEAQKCADTYARQMEFDQKCDVVQSGQYGSTVYADRKPSKGNPTKAMNKAVRLEWYPQVSHYNFTAGSPIDKEKYDTADFTQMIWKESKTVGFGCAESSDHSLYVVALYDPAGNKPGEFDRNVIRSRSPIDGEYPEENRNETYHDEHHYGSKGTSIILRKNMLLATIAMIINFITGAIIIKT